MLISEYLYAGLCHLGAGVLKVMTVALAVYAISATSAGLWYLGAGVLKMMTVALAVYGISAIWRR